MMLKRIVQGLGVLVAVVAFWAVVVVVNAMREREALWDAVTADRPRPESRQEVT